MSIRKLTKTYGRRRDDASAANSTSPLTVNVQVENNIEPYTVLTHAQLVKERYENVIKSSDAKDAVFHNATCFGCVATASCDGDQRITCMMRSNFASVFATKRM